VSVDQERVLREAEDWVWVPTDAEDDTTDERRLTVYPDRVSVQWSRTGRPFDDLLAEVTVRAAATGRPVLHWWTRPSSRPDDIGDHLVAHGFRRAEVLDVFALDLSRPGAAADLHERLEVPAEVEVRRVTDEGGVRAAGRLAAEAFGEDEPTEAQVAEAVERLAEEERTGRWQYRRWIASVDGRDVGSAGATLVGDLVRLWGGAVLADARGRGAYRALLSARCGDAVAAGASVALVKGRVSTSGPTLRRAGFQVFGQEVRYDLPLG